MKILKSKSSDKSEAIAKVKWGQGLTLTQNYNGMRFDCGVEIMCAESEIAATFAKAKKHVELQLEAALDENKTVLGDLSAVTKQ